MTESDLLQQATAMLPAIVDSVEALVCVESPTEDLDACASIAQEAVGVFSAWLPSPARVEVHNDRPVWRWGPDRPRILLLGHLDTVWPIGTLARIPFSNDGERLRGPGVFDMKAGVVQAWAALALCGLDEDSGVGMLLTSDEETGSLASQTLIADSTVGTEAVLVFEPSIDSALKIARKGTSWYSVDFEGRAAHAGLDPELGINALASAAAFITDSGSWGDAAQGTTVTPTTLRGGTTANTVPAQAQLTVDVRAWTFSEQARVDQLVRGWRPSVGGVTVVGGINRPAMEKSMSSALFALAQGAGAAVGIQTLEGRAVGGASDGNFTAAAGIPTLDGLGAVGDGAHADHEWASIAGLAERAALSSALISRLLALPTA
jgi:glutamate carboxypeptidase